MSHGAGWSCWWWNVFDVVVDDVCHLWILLPRCCGSWLYMPYHPCGGLRMYKWGLQVPQSAPCHRKTCEALGKSLEHEGKWCSYWSFSMWRRSWETVINASAVVLQLQRFTIHQFCWWWWWWCLQLLLPCAACAQQSQRQNLGPVQVRMAQQGCLQLPAYPVNHASFVWMPQCSPG